jgi:RimJ/RimL family protein N-acetyltransferase
VILTLSADRRPEVDALADKAPAAGGTPAADPIDLGSCRAAGVMRLRVRPVVRRVAPVPTTASSYPPLNLGVHTPRLSLLGARDELLERLVPVVRKGVVTTEPWPFDDPMSLYKDSPDREWSWLRGVWTGRGKVSDSFWRLYFVVVVDGEPVGMQDLKGVNFGAFGTVETFSWLSPDARGQGLGKEMRQAVLHLAFEGLGARQADSGAFVDNRSSNGVSQAVGYLPNGLDWATRRGEAAEIQRWRMTRQRWAERRRDDITLVGVDECLPVLGIPGQPDR